MAKDFIARNPELDKLFDRYRESPHGYVFAPLADACRKEGLLDEAIEICTNGLKLHPNYPSGHVVMGKCYYEKAMKDEAVEAFKRVLSLDPENLVALKFIGLILSERGDKKGAVERFKHILTLDPANKEVKAKLKELGWDDEKDIFELEEVDDEDFEGAEITLGKEDVTTSDELATVTLADIFTSQGYREKAIRIYKELLSRDPNNEIVKAKLESLGAGVKGAQKSASSKEQTKGNVRAKERAHIEDGWDGEDSEGEEIDYDKALEDILEGESLDENAPGDKPKKAPASTTCEEERKTPDAEDNKSHTPKAMEEKQSFEHFKRWLKKAGE